MEITTVTSKGQMTIPADIRRALKINAGDRLQCLVEDDHLLLIPARGSIRNLKGFIPKPKRPVSLEAMNEAVAAEAAERGQGR